MIGRAEERKGVWEGGERRAQREGRKDALGGGWRRV